MLLAFLASVRDLCLFRRGPEDVPYSPTLLIALLVASALVEVLFDWYRSTSLLLAPAAVAGTLATLGTLVLLLRWRGKLERFVQTTMALVATSLLFELIATPLVSLVMPLAQGAGNAAGVPHPSGGQALAALAVFGLAIWQICISISILRRSLEIPIIGGVLALLVLACVNWVVVAMGAHALGVV